MESIKAGELQNENQFDPMAEPFRQVENKPVSKRTVANLKTPVHTRIQVTNEAEESSVSLYVQD